MEFKMIYSAPQIKQPEELNSMPPFKTTLFLAYCLMAVVLVGSAFSHLYRTSRLLTRDQVLTSTQKSLIGSDTASLPTHQPNQSQS